MTRRTGAPALVAAAATLVAFMGLFSALSPEIASRSRIVVGTLPAGWPSAARTLTIAISFGLLWLARGLARRKHRAWQLAVLLLVGSSLTHLAQGLDVEESLGSVVALVLLLATRRTFVAPGDPGTGRPLVQVGAALTFVAAVLLAHGEGLVAYSGRVNDALAIAAGVLATRALFLWLRPVTDRVTHVPADRRQAERLVQEHGSDSLAYFALRKDKSLFFSATRRSFLAYRVVSATAIVAGDPIGDVEERPELIEEFRRVAHAKGWRVAVAGASAEGLADYTELGFRAIYLGDEAYVRPATFSLDGRPIRKVRQSATRLEKAGYRVEIVSPEDVPEERRCEIRAVSEEWRGRWPERGFTMAMDAMFAYPECLLAIATGPDGEIGGFLQLVPSPASKGYSLASMRRRRDTPNGLMEYLIVETLAWAQKEEVTELSLNFAVFAEYLGGDRRLLRTLLLRADRLFQLERLHSFNRKFFPEWRRRYFCFERWTDLPPSAIAYMRAESLLTPPGPWAAKAPDLTAR